MTNDEFTELVRQMRKAQKDFFSTRSKEVLRICKNLERRVIETIAVFKIYPKYAGKED